MPGGVDDPARPSGGNTYDRRLGQGLVDLGWQVHRHPVAGPWPRPDAHGRTALGALLAEMASGAAVVIDGLVACAVPDLLVPEAGRLRLVVLVHMPLGHPLAGLVVGTAQARERAVLSAAASVVATSQWSRDWLLRHYALEPGRVQVAQPGVDAAGLATGTAAGGRLLCVGAVTPVKGQDVLLAALAMVRDRTWRCDCVGALDIDPGFVARLGHQARQLGITARLRFRGPLVGGDLDAAYCGADALVVASRTETYGMVVTEALAHGLPVVATSAGGIPEALGRSPDGSRPGLLVPSGDVPALADGLSRWLDDASRREGLRRAAAERRATLPRWTHTSQRISEVLEELRW
jgi:glycosyltransferase involved in cell wall biosynthesis